MLGFKNISFMIRLILNIFMVILGVMILSFVGTFFFLINLLRRDSYRKEII